MRIACLGGGPAGLYFAISMKLREPAHEIDLSGIDANSALAGHQAFTFVGNAAGKGAGELSMQRFGNMNAAEKALGMELDGIDGDSPFSGPVTVLLGNVDGGAYDFAMVFVNTPTINTTDLIFS